MCSLGRGKGAEVEASKFIILSVYKNKVYMQIDTKFRRILWNSVEYRKIPQKLSV
jgi:hypothetical protein